MILNLDQNFKPFAPEQEINFQNFTFSGGEPHIKINPDFDTTQKVTITHRLNSFNDFGLLCVAVDALRRMDVKNMELFIPYFPAARQGLPIGQYDTSIIDRIIEQTCDGEVDIYSALINTVKDEIRTHSDVNPCAIDADAELQFAMDVDNCVDGAPVGWQYALDDIMFIMNIVWPHLDEEQQRRLFTENDALIKRYLYSMPERTSLRLRDKIVSGQFSLETGNIVSIDPCDGGGHMLRHAPAADGSVVTEFAPLVIDASGLKKKRLFIQADRTASLTPSPRPMAFACGSFTSSDFEGVHWLGSMVSSLPVVNYIRMIAWHAHLLTTEITSESDSATA